MQCSWAEDAGSAHARTRAAAVHGTSPLPHLPAVLHPTVHRALPSPTELTFILLDPDFPDTPGTGTHGGTMAGAPPCRCCCRLGP